jgi:hypothetical protein
MDNYTPLTNSVNTLLKQGYRCQLNTGDFAVLARQRPIGETIHIVTVSADGTIENKPLSQFLEELING